MRSERGGVLQAIDAAGLMAAATRHDCVFVMVHPVGDFVAPGATLVEAHGDTSALDPRGVTGHVALGAERTIEQDPLCPAYPRRHRHPCALARRQRPHDRRSGAQPH
ncbi:DUF2254 family protein [Streptomyces sp. NPDC019443]|uniref:DUF2254 family protein n=1 Tax=Streptomyces sp. NPDC019443 TaxID=3365061 RepID=UPI00378ACEFB